MTDFQICLCGTQPGYTHSVDCPFPYYGNIQDTIINWETARNNNRIQRHEPEEAKPRESRTIARFIKVEKIGDFWKRKTYPRIRIKGNWVKDAGIKPNSYVRIENPTPGVLIVTQTKR